MITFVTIHEFMICFIVSMFWNNVTNNNYEKSMYLGTYIMCNVYNNNCNFYDYVILQ